MKLAFKLEGGLAYFPGLAREIVIPDSALTAKEAQRIERLIESLARAAPPASPVAPDSRRYQVHAETDSGQYHFVVSELSTEPAARELAEWLADKARSLRKSG